MTGLYTELCLPQGRGWEYLDDWTIYRGVSTPGEGGGSTWMTGLYTEVCLPQGRGVGVPG